MKSMEAEPMFKNTLGLQWENKLAISRANQFWASLGEPICMGKCRGGCISWNNVEMLADREGRGYVFDELKIVDEAVEHVVPAIHMDFFYVCMKLECPEERINSLLSLSESVMYDRLKRQVIVRCHFMPANIVSLYLATKIAKGDKSAAHARQEYGVLIMQLAMEEKMGNGILNSQVGMWHTKLLTYIAER
jgi:hypothetical protein